MSSMNTFCMDIKDKYLTLIKRGIKTVECRCGYRFKYLNVGDEVQFRVGYTKKVKKIERFPNIEGFIKSAAFAPGKYESIIRKAGFKNINDMLINLDECYPNYNGEPFTLIWIGG